MKTKYITLIAVLTLIIALMPSFVFAENEKHTTTHEINGVEAKFEYYLNENDQIIDLKCTNVNELAGDITIPGNLDGKEVVSLAIYSFEDAANITSVNIPDSITEIKAKSFNRCSNLESVDLNKVTKIGHYAFDNCPKLKSVTIPKTLISGPGEISNGVFEGTTKLTSVTFENGNTVIAAGILKGCTDITTINIPNTVKEIKMYAFGNTGLKEIEIPESVTRIEGYAFADCSDLTKITILDTCEYIGLDTFRNHNDDLTIYCYEGSKAAEYAIENNIKYVYLTRETNNNDNTNTNTTNENVVINENTNKPVNNQIINTQKDSTTATNNIPQTGATMEIVVIIALIITASVLLFFKWYKYRKM